MASRSALAGAALLFAGAAAAAEPEPLSFSAGGERLAATGPDLASLDVGEKGGLTLCFSDALEARLAEFTSSHVGETVTVAIGDSDVFHLTVVEPYASGCIVWPLHPRIAARYRDRLTGEAGEH